MSGELEAPFNFLQSVVREFDEAKRVVRMTLAGFERNSPTSYVIAAAKDKMVIAYFPSFFYFFFSAIENYYKPYLVTVRVGCVNMQKVF